MKNIALFCLIIASSASFGWDVGFEDNQEIYISVQEDPKDHFKFSVAALDLSHNDPINEKPISRKELLARIEKAPIDEKNRQGFKDMLDSSLFAPTSFQDFIGDLRELLSEK